MRVLGMPDVKNPAHCAFAALKGGGTGAAHAALDGT